MTDELIERVARAIEEQMKLEITPELLAQAALAALKPGDEVGDDIIVVDTWNFNGIRRQAAEEMRERCASWLEQQAQQFTEPTKTVVLVKANAIRALPLEPSEDKSKTAEMNPIARTVSKWLELREDPINKFHLADEINQFLKGCSPEDENEYYIRLHAAYMAEPGE